MSLLSFLKGVFIMVGTIKMNEQEMTGMIDFNKTFKVMTANFLSTFGNQAQEIVENAIQMIAKAHPEGADYMQTFEYHNQDDVIRFWLIVDIGAYEGQNVLTALLPEDY